MLPKRSSDTAIFRELRFWPQWRPHRAVEAAGRAHAEPSAEHVRESVSSRICLTASSEPRMSANGSWSVWLRGRFKRHENCSPRTCHGINQNKNHDLLLTTGVEPSGSTLLIK